MTSLDLDHGLWLVYDGECPLCAFTAKTIKIRQSAGNLVLLDARLSDPTHPLLRKIVEQNLNLNNGIVVRYGGQLYHGADAIHLLAILGTSVDGFNRIASLLFRSKFRSRLLYPPLRAIRNLLLFLNHIKPIAIANINQTSNDPIFKSIFGAVWDQLPAVMKLHYANRPYTNDMVSVSGQMDIHPTWFIRVLAPIAKYAGVLVPYAGRDIPTTVEFRSDPANSSFTFNRIFQLPRHGTFVFRSRMVPQPNGDMIEFMRSGIGWRTAYRYNGSKIQLLHRGYVLRLLGRNIPLPISSLIGRGYAEEEAIDDQSFRMMMEIRHPLFGQIYQYCGTFQVQDVKIND